MLDKEGKHIRHFGSLGEAVKELGINKANLSQCLKGRRKTAGGYRWSLIVTGKHSKFLTQ
jgi:DNA-binding transcriptional regulator YdaS (Cro superfamily)